MKTKTIKIKLNKQIKKQEKLLKENLRKTRAVRVKLIKEMKEEPLLKEAQELLSEFETISKKTNTIYTLNESENVIERNYDDILLEWEQGKVTDDDVYKFLDESFSYENNLYFSKGKQNIDEVFGLSSQEKIDKAAAAIDAGEGPEADAGVIQRLKNWAGEKWKEIQGWWDKGVLVFALKIIEQGLQFAIKIIGGWSKFLRRMIQEAAGFAIKSIASAAAGAAGIKINPPAFWEKWKEAIMPKVQWLMKQIMKPFNWMAAKLTADPEKQKILAPLLLSIAISLIILGVVIATSGVGAVDAARQGTAAGLQEAAAASPAAFVCGAAGAVLHERRLLKEDCEALIDQNGETVSNEICQEAMNIMVEDFNTAKEAAKGTLRFRATFTDPAEAAGVAQDFAEKAADATGDVVQSSTKQWASEFGDRTATIVRYTQVSGDQATQAFINLEDLQGAIGGVQSAVDVRELNSVSRSYMDSVLERAQAQAAGLSDVVTDDDVKGLADSIVTTIRTQSELTVDKSVEAVDGVVTASKHTAQQILRAIPKAIEVAPGAGEVAATAAKAAGELTELKRMKELAGIV